MSTVAGIGGGWTGAPARAGTVARWLEAERGRWVLWLPVLYGTGVAFYFALPFEPDVAGPAALLAATLVLAWVARGAGTIGGAVVLALVAAASGVLAAKVRTEWIRAPILDTSLTAARVRGHLELIEPRPGNGQRLTILVTSIDRLPSDRTPRRVRVRTAQSDPTLTAGTAVIVTATLSAPGAPAAPGDYDFGRAAFYSGLGAVGYSTGRAVVDPYPGPRSWQLEAEALIGQARQAISRRVTAALPGESGAIADALISGERGGISQATNDAYRASGLFHILSISGLHMTVMAGAVYITLRLLLAAIPALALRYPIKKWAAGAATVAALGYLLLSGASFATVRSWVMISIMLLAVLLDRPAIALRNVALAALAIMLVMPESIFDAGFQMSFAAVLALVAAYEEIGRRRRTAPDRTRGPVAQLMRFFGGILLSTAIATAAVAPFAIYHFHTTQWYSALANMVALPVSDLLVMPAALATLVAMPFGLEAWPLAVMDVGIRVMTWTATTVAALPGSVSRVPAISQTAFVLMVIGGLWICLWGTHVRWVGFLLVAAGVALAPLTERPDVLVGRGGRLVAVRGPDGLLQALGDRSAAYDLGRWLEREGDGRPVRDALKAAAWRCDAVGCTIGAGPRVIAVSQHPAAVVDDCARAAVVVMAFRRPRACDGPALVIDAAAIEAEGAHAVRFVEGGFELATVSRARQARPWNTLATVRAISASIRARAARFAPPYSLIEPPLPNVPGIEDFTEPRPGDEP